MHKSLSTLSELSPLFGYFQECCPRDDPFEPFDVLLGVVLEIDVELVHHHRLQLVELLLGHHHFVLPLDQSLVHDRHHELESLLDYLKNLTPPL
jgi:hypothetical protein